MSTKQYLGVLFVLALAGIGIARAMTPPEVPMTLAEAMPAVSGATAPADGWGYTRACLLGANPWTAVATSNLAAAYTAALTPFQRYAIQCDDDTYFRPTAAAASGAAAGDAWIPAGAWYDHIVITGATYVSLLNKTKDSDCRYALCQ